MRLLQALLGRRTSKPTTQRPPPPTSQPIPPFSAIENRAVGVINESPEIVAALTQICPDTIVAHFEGIGTAVADVATSRDEDNTVYWHTWLEHGQHEAGRKSARAAYIQSLKNGITAEITIPTRMIEVFYQGFMFSLGDFDDIVVKPTASFSDDATKSMLDNFSRLPSVAIGIGSRARTPQGIRSPRLYNATGSEPDRAASRKLNWDCFKIWIKDPWGRQQNENPPRAKITTL